MREFDREGGDGRESKSVKVTDWNSGFVHRPVESSRFGLRQWHLGKEQE